MNSRNLFYVRSLQVKFYFKKNEIVKTLFFLENYLFSLLKQSDEVLVIKLKVKWIYDQIKNNNYTNELTKNLNVFRDEILKKQILNLIEFFSNVIEEKELNNIFDIFKKINSIFNSIIKYSGSNFVTSVYFQFFQYIYRDDFKNIGELKKGFLNNQMQINDKFEDIFNEVFFKFYILKKKKLTKSLYLFYLLISFFKKNESKIS